MNSVDSVAIESSQR